MNKLIFVPGISEVCFRPNTLPEAVLIRDEEQPGFSSDFVAGCYSTAAHELGELPGPSEISMVPPRLFDSPADRLLDTRAAEIDEPGPAGKYNIETPQDAKGAAAQLVLDRLAECENNNPSLPLSHFRKIVESISETTESDTVRARLSGGGCLLDIPISYIKKALEIADRSPGTSATFIRRFIRDVNHIAEPKGLAASIVGAKKKGDARALQIVLTGLAGIQGALFTPACNACPNLRNNSKGEPSCGLLLDVADTGTKRANVGAQGALLVGAALKSMLERYDLSAEDNPLGAKVVPDGCAIRAIMRLARTYNVHFRDSLRPPLSRLPVTTVSLGKFAATLSAEQE